MGLIRAAVNTVSGTLADQWLDFFYCEAMPDTLLVTKGKRQANSRSVNTKGNDNIISNGSGIAVADGQCMLIVEQGRIIDFSAEPGQYTWDQSTEPSVFSGDLGKSITDTFQTMARRFAHGGGTGKDQRIYYINIKELTNNKFGTANPIPFRIVNTDIGLNLSVSIRCNGVYSYKISDPILFYTNVSGNVQQDYTRDMIDAQLKSEFLAALQPAFARLSAKGMLHTELPLHTMEIAEALNTTLSEKWGNLRGLDVVSISIKSVTIPKEDEDMIKQLERKAVMRDPSMAGAALVAAQADAMKAAANNTGGAMTGFLGMGMAQQAGGGMNAQDFFAMSQQNQQAQAAAAPAPAQAAPNANGLANGWNCACGASNTGRFCSDCGTPKPASDDWACPCGTQNTGKFCSDCGTPKN